MLSGHYSSPLGSCLGPAAERCRVGPVLVDRCVLVLDPVGVELAMERTAQEAEEPRLGRGSGPWVMSPAAEK